MHKIPRNAGSFCSVICREQNSRVNFVQSDDNYADLYTKNVKPDIFEKLSDYVHLTDSTDGSTVSRWVLSMWDTVP